MLFMETDGLVRNYYIFFGNALDMYFCTKPVVCSVQGDYISSGQSCQEQCSHYIVDS